MTSLDHFSLIGIHLFSRMEMGFNPSTSPRYPRTLAEVLMGLIGQEVTPIALAARNVKPVSADDLDFWERKLEQELVNDSTVRETERLAIIRARNGQGLFKERVSKIESRCRITGVENPVHLLASHCKPWRDSTNEERLNGENGLLLTPSIDHLFDRGFIGFEDNGKLIISPVAHHPSLQRMGIDTTKGCQRGRVHQRPKTVPGFSQECRPASVRPWVVLRNCARDLAAAKSFELACYVTLFKATGSAGLPNGSRQRS